MSLEGKEYNGQKIVIPNTQKKAETIADVVNGVAATYYYYIAMEAYKKKWIPI